MKHTRDQDTVCRIGGDEFLYLLVDPAGRENVARIACLLQATLSEPMSVNGLEIVIRPSIGIAVYPDQATNADVLLAQADEAMYRSKRRQTGCEFYEPEDPQPR